MYQTPALSKRQKSKFCKLDLSRHAPHLAHHRELVRAPEVVEATSRDGYTGAVSAGVLGFEELHRDSFSGGPSVGSTGEVCLSTDVVLRRSCQENAKSKIP